MKKQLLFATFIVLAMNVLARPRDIQEGLQIADEFFTKLETSLGKQKSSSMQGEMKLLYNQKSSDKDVLFVFGRSQVPGYVIVSADDRVDAILGYSYNSVFDAENIPANLAFWLQGYEIEMLQLKDEEEFIDASYIYEQPQYTGFAPSVQPLLGGIQWNQDEPFNNLAPKLSGSTRTASGCVATAMAQVMKFHEWPLQGKGSKSYRTTTFKYKLSVDFSEATYDWANMTDVYNSKSTQEENDAVALLVYHCGVAVEMDYAQSSGAFTHDIAPAMIDHFSYDGNMQLWTRDFYSYPEWLQLLKTEINASRPVLYGGVSDDGGHQFVLDGYDENDFFHVNWGWGGMSDGYFKVAALDPYSHGIGGGDGGFNYSQNLYTGIQKPSPTSSKAISQFNTQAEIRYPTNSQNRTSSFKTTLSNAYNYGAYTLTNVVFGLGFYDLNDSRKAVIEIATRDAYEPLQGLGSIQLEASNGVPSNLSAGNYKMYVVFKSDADDDWLKVRYYAGNPSYTNVTLTDTNISFTKPTNESPDLELVEIAPIGNLYKDRLGRFMLKVKNNGKDFNSKIAILLEQVDDSSQSQWVVNKVLPIPEGETAEFLLSGDIKLDAGEYMLSARYGLNNSPTANTPFGAIGTGVQVTINPAPVGSSVLELSAPISFPDNKKVNPENAELSATITNTGTYFDDDVVAFVFPKDGGKSIAYFGYQTLYLETNETVEVKFTGDIDLDPGEYLVGVFFYDIVDDAGWTQMTPYQNSALLFKLLEKTVDNVEKIADNIQLTLSPVPSKDFLNIQSATSIQAFEVYTITGQMLLNQQLEGVNKTQINTSNWESGIYILHVRTSEGVQTKSFVVE